MKRSLTFILPVFVIGAFLFISFKNMQERKQKPRINHLAIYVSDLAKSTRFYRDIIGLDTIPEPFHDGLHTWFSMGDRSHLHVIAGAKTPIAQDKNHHLCFSVESVEEFTKILATHSIAYENWAGQPNTLTNRVDGVKQLWLRDPDGYWIEINDARD